MKIKVLLSLILLLVSISVFVLPIGYLLNFAHDDSFFYLKIANNISLGYGSTFDTVNATNGYHPLWLLVLTLIFTLVNGLLDSTPEALYRITFLLHILLCIIISYSIYKLSKYELDNKRNNYFALSFLLFNSSFLFIRDVGMESTLAALLFSLSFLDKAINNNEINKINYSHLFPSLLFLTRIDYLLSIIPAVLIGDYLTTVKIVRRKKLVLQIIILVIVTSTYFIINYNLFGSITTISSKIKTDLPKLFIYENIPSLLDIRISIPRTIILFFIVITIIYFPFHYKRKNINLLLKIDLYVFVLSCGSLLFLFWNICFNHENITQWYITVPLFISSFLFFRYLYRYPKLQILMIYLSFILLIIVFVYTRILNQKWVNSYLYAKQIKPIIMDDKLFQVDGSGLVGFFSEVKIINGDGLTNSFEYLQYLRDRNLKTYFKKFDIKYYSTYSAILDSTGEFYIDRRYLSNDTLHRYPLIKNAYHFKFPQKNLIYQYPYRFEHFSQNQQGEWMIFRIQD